jgi:hypothetical protein
MNTDDLIEDALTTYPLADVPPNFSHKIMGQIRAAQEIKSVRSAAPRTPFRLTWMDYALGFFLALLPAVGFVIWATLPRLALLDLTFEWQLIQFQAESFLPIFGISLGIIGFCLFLAFLFSLPYLFNNRRPVT